MAIGCLPSDDFELTDAVTPVSRDTTFTPVQGYCHAVYRNKETAAETPVIIISLTREKIMEVFLALLDALGDTVDVALDSSHDHVHGGDVPDREFRREDIDLPVLKSFAGEYGDLLVHDGCTSIGVFNPDLCREVQIDAHKLLFVYGGDCMEWETILRKHAILPRENMTFINAVDHMHSSSDCHAEQFEELRCRLGAEEDGDDDREESNRAANC